MRSNTIQNSLNLSQQNISMEANETMSRIRLFNYVDQLIRSNGKYTSDGIRIYADDLDYSDKKEFLQHLSHPDDYAYYTSKPEIEKTAIQDSIDEMQFYIDERKDDVWHEDVWELSQTKGEYI